MKISQEVRDFADAQNLSVEEAKQKGMNEMSQTFKDKGGEVYIPAE
jgi:phosphomethylpyrimidine synthase